jgi:SAM-dependent methyltransferase
VAREVYGQDVVTGALEPGMFEPGSFDVVTFWDVIEHVPDPVYTLGVAAELLAPGGLMVLKTPNVDGLYPKASLALASRLGFWGHPEPPGHLFQFSEKTLSRLAAGAGLQPRTTVHQRIPLNYSFGTPREWLRSVKWAVYCAAFLPMAGVLQITSGARARRGAAWAGGESALPAPLGAAQPCLAESGPSYVRHHRSFRHPRSAPPRARAPAPDERVPAPPRS